MDTMIRTPRSRAFLPASTRRPIRWLSLTAALALAPLCGLAAQDLGDTLPDTVRLSDLVVTATRVPLPREALPTPVTTLSGARLREAGVRTVADALREVTSAAVVRAGAAGAQTSLFLRGGESDYVKILVDGVPVNDPGGAFDLADLTTEQIERIEVVRGPVSVLYGSDAISGVVQLFTRRGRGAPSVTARLSGGLGGRPDPPTTVAGDDGGDGTGTGEAASAAIDPGFARGGDTYGDAEAAASVAGSTGAVSYAFGGSRSWTNGLYRINNGRDLSTGSARVAWTAAPGTELALTARLSDSRSGFPTDGTGAVVDRNARIDRTRITSALDGGFRLSRRIDAAVRIGLAHRRRLSLDDRDGPADTLGIFASELQWNVARLSADAHLNARLPWGVLTAGASLDDARADTRYTSDSEWGPAAASADYHRTSAGYYAQVLAQPGDAVHVTAGARLDRSATYGDFQTYRLGATLRVAPGFRFRGAVGRGFREPAFDESFGSGFGDRGNPDLAPEQSHSWEMGLEHDLGSTAWIAATWFQQRFEDLIQFTFASPEPDAPSYFNVGAASARGLEIEASARFGPLDLAAGYTRLFTEVLDPGLASDAAFSAGRRLLRRPRQSGSLHGRLSAAGGALLATITAVGTREDLDFAAGYPAPRVSLPAYATLHLALERRLPLAGPATTLALAVDNVLDTTYETVRGFPAPGRLVRLIVELRAP